MATTTATKVPTPKDVATATATATPEVVTDPILVLLTDAANEAITYAQSFGPLVQKSADFVKVLAHLDGMGHAGNDEIGESDLANALRSIVQTFDTATATVALTVARAKYATVVQYCKGEGIDLPSDLLSLTGSASNTEGGQKRLKGYTYAISANGQSVSYANVADLATALKGKASDYREAAHATVGDERPESFTFEVDGITVTATKSAE